jgi:hypothetical protein
MVYRTTPMGSRKQAAAVGTPHSALATALPPVKSMAVTKILVMRPKVKKTTCVITPYLALITSRKVCAFGARLFSLMACQLAIFVLVAKEAPYSMAMVAKSRIWTVAPEAYQNGPVKLASELLAN